MEVNPPAQSVACRRVGFKFEGAPGAALGLIEMDGIRRKAGIEIVEMHLPQCGIEQRAVANDVQCVFEQLLGAVH